MCRCVCPHTQAVIYCTHAQPQIHTLSLCLPLMQMSSACLYCTCICPISYFVSFECIKNVHCFFSKPSAVLLEILIYLQCNHICCELIILYRTVKTLLQGRDSALVWSHASNVILEKPLHWHIYPWLLRHSDSKQLAIGITLSMDIDVSLKTNYSGVTLFSLVIFHLLPPSG